MFVWVLVLVMRSVHLCCCSSCEVDMDLNRYALFHPSTHSSSHTTTIHPPTPPFILPHHHSSSHTTIHPPTPPFILPHHHSSSHTTIHPPTPPFILPHHHSSSHTTIHLPTPPSICSSTYSPSIHAMHPSLHSCTPLLPRRLRGEVQLGRQV